MSDLEYTIAAWGLIILSILAVAIWIRAEFGDPPE